MINLYGDNSMVGLKIFQSEKSLELINNLKKIVDNTIAGLHPKYDGNLGLLHQVVSADEVNNLRIEIFKNLNAESNNVIDILKDLALRDLTAFIGPDILCQNKINFSIQMPNDPGSTLDLHSDCWAGDTPYEINLWIPLTDAYETNSMFLFDEEKSIKSIQKLYQNINNGKYDLTSEIDNSDYIDIKYGQFLIFNPALLHGNVTNKTINTRASINLRFK
jgi:sporadic carbohydrate cluster 2OG-Fe(II) oxygenase